MDTNIKYEETVTAWVTKYALTSGIIETKGQVSDTGSLFFGKHGYAYRKDWQTSEQLAIERFHEMRLKKISSLKKQIEKLEKMQLKILKK